MTNHQTPLLICLFIAGFAATQIPLLTAPSKSLALWGEKPGRETVSLTKPTTKEPKTSSTAAAAVAGSIHGTITTVPARAASSAVVYLEKGPASHKVNGVIDNKQLAFVPHVLVITAGGKVDFVNNDPFPHNVFSPDHEKFDIGSLPPKGKKSKIFNHVGAYTLLCNIHPNMKAYLVVSPTSYFSKTNQDGSFTISNVPEGTYKVTAWAPGVKSATQTVRVTGDATANFELRRK